MTPGEFRPTPNNVDKKLAQETRLPVYRNMQEDPAYQGEGVLFHVFTGEIFGYTMAQEKDGKIQAICGNEGKVPYLHIHDKVKPKGDYQALGGLDPNQDAEIVEIAKPFEDGKTDKIICLQQGDKIVWIKPCQMEKNY
ncbi:MAG: hypothetical protein A2233_01580 [Candidatus Kerfeldbacteria bacterium RIFOXYA2_FULL_38_24]|uniref:Uncharacterized protein n=1 Tax=Candidatus Kerfeldbacteria bacterium RIFOXYB2_FULL_38_14 TaxID=1798547 RepID=A0A1G2BEE6_9BACT|nr:MAG: hypothetical protein A2319_04190 [Candidatus Kerfeldbacteria bacterium RIFOXYB2_FULL_38_14]OGY87811.1 MAG: hypothetical protein A2233_01580 [Candidatus Kerfeldbacteria bacterium RIFOXYA2_FULL_38_24]